MHERRWRADRATDADEYANPQVDRDGDPNTITDCIADALGPELPDVVLAS